MWQKGTNLTDLVTLRNISKTYREAKSSAVEGINFSVSEGEFFCFVGPSGCGKSTILKMIAGIEQPSSGTLNKPDEISMVFQSGALLPWMNVSDNAGFGLKMKGLPKEEKEARVKKYLDMVKLTHYEQKYPRELSGGQRQRVGIARALSMEPKVFLLDEPFSALDPLTTEELHDDLLAIWNSTKTTIIMVSHLLEEAVMLSDRIAVMAEGHIREIIDIPLPRPRNEHSDDFQRKIAQIRKILLGE